ncbi:histidine kinase [Prolixibacteraceae bacterium JC049]|nr:histidine kinase [Prolixibacteraceae bacterium JC049]
MNNRLVYIATLLLLMTLKLNAHNSRVDSLKMILDHTTNPIEQINLQIKIAKASQPIEGIQYAQEALMLAQKHNIPQKEGLAYEVLSLRQRKLGNYAEAVQASFSALKIYDRLEMHKAKAVLQLQIGTHYANDKDFINATHYLNLALHNFRSRKDTSNLALTLINIGEAYRSMHEPDSAITCFSECLELNKILKRSIIEGYCLGNMGLAQLEKKQYEVAQKNILDAITILKKLKDIYSVVIYEAYLGKLYAEKGEQEKAEKLLQKNLILAKENQLREQVRDINKDLAEFYEKRTQYQKALYHHKLYLAYNDSLVDKDNIRKMERIKSEYLLEKKEANIQFLHQLNNSRVRFIYVISISAAVLLILSGFLFRSRKLLKNANAVVLKRGKEKELLLRELNHRVKNNLQMVASLFNIQARKLEGPAAKELKEARMRIEALALIHQKLYRNHLNTMVDMENYIKELIENLCFSFGKKLDVTFELDPVKLHIDKAIPMGIIINELATNTFKYATAQDNPTLKVQLSEVDSEIILSLKDNGPGIEENTDPTKQNSLGMTLVKSLIKQLQGKFNFDGSNGCQWVITIANNS